MCALRQPLGEQRLQLFPPLRENAESSSIVRTVDEETDPNVMVILAEEEEVLIGKNANSTSQKHIKLEHTKDMTWMRFYNIWKVALE